MKPCLWLTLFLMLALSIPDARADLRDSTHAADYLIIAPAEVLRATPWISELADWRAEHGRTPMLIASEFIWTEFGSGIPSDSALKDFLFYAYRHWRSPRLKDVFLIGWHDQIPSHIVPSGIRDYLSDSYYAADPDSLFRRPRFNIGRLPWNPAVLPASWFNKIVAYETAPTAEWQSRIHVIADRDDRTAEWWREAEVVLDSLRPGYTAIRNYLEFLPGHEWSGDSARLRESLELGSLLLMPWGIPSFGYWGVNIPVDSAYVTTLSNSPRLPIVVGISHDVSPNTLFHLSPLPQSMLANPEGGAMAYLATTGYTFIFFMRACRETLLTLIADDSIRTAGDLWCETICRSVDPSMLQSFMLLGDPALRLPERHLDSEAPSSLSPYPLSLSLSCFPNPFNPVTTIQFNLAHAGRIKLMVTNVLGQTIETLIDEQRTAGTQSVFWSGERYTSGLYFAVLEADGVRRVQKMMLLK